MENKKHFCIIVGRYTKEIYAEYIVEAPDWYGARHIAANLYEKEHVSNHTSNIEWCVDSMEVDE